MYVINEDSHPGRCLNMRAAAVPYYGELLRCLRMEGHEGSCRFPASAAYSTSARIGSGYSPPKPKPWVEPE